MFLLRTAVKHFWGMSTIWCQTWIWRYLQYLHLRISDITRCLWTISTFHRLLVKFLIKQKTLVLRTACLCRSSTILPYSPPTVASVKQSIGQTQPPSCGRTATDRYFHYWFICQKTFSISKKCARGHCQITCFVQPTVQRYNSQWYTTKKAANQKFQKLNPAYLLDKWLNLIIIKMIVSVDRLISRLIVSAQFVCHLKNLACYIFTLFSPKT